MKIDTKKLVRKLEALGACTPFLDDISRVRSTAGLRRVVSLDDLEWLAGATGVLGKSAERELKRVTEAEGIKYDDLPTSCGGFCLICLGEAASAKGPRVVRKILRQIDYEKLARVARVDL